MSKITLTDRISVSVRAKNDTESNQQKVDTGNNIANALGGTNVNDVDAANVGTTSKPTITDENGNEWVSMQDIIDAGKKMQQNGAFGETTSYNGIGGYKFDPVVSGPVDIVMQNPSSNWSGMIDISHVPSGVLVFAYHSQNERIGFYAFSETNFEIPYDYASGANATNATPPPWGTISANSVTATIDGVSYSFFMTNPHGYGGQVATNATINIEHATSIPNDTSKCAAGILFGGSTTTGGSLIDWNAPNAEIERQIKELHETWDVSEHEGAVTANGTYVLAGPIEYNDADPVG